MKLGLSTSIARVWFNPKGFSLVEVLLSGALFALLVTVLVGAYLYGQESTVLAGNRARAVFLAEEGIEAVRNIRDNDFINLSDGIYGLQILANKWQLSSSSDQTGIFVRQIEISTIDSDTKQIISRVNWRQNAQRTGEIVLTDYLTNWSKIVVSSNCDIVATGTYIEAESFTGAIAQGTATFVEESSVTGYNGTGYLRSNGGDTVDPPIHEGKQYLVTFTDPGTYNVWVRGYGFDGVSDSIWVGLNDVSTGALTEATYNAWEWTNNIQSGVNTISIPSAGNYYINIWIRENAHLIDGIYLTTGVEVPSGGLPAGATIIDPTSCTLTPPINSCDAYCQDAGYLSGSCRQNDIQCTNNGEVYQSGGDLYCTGGASADTCCCLPGSDIIAPAVISDLILSSPTANSIDLTWTASGDDGNTGTATTYDIRYSTVLIDDTNWASATQVTGEPTPSIATSVETMIVTGLDPNTIYYFAIKTSDEIPNESTLSNVSNLSTTSGIDDWSIPFNSTNMGWAGRKNGWKVQVQGDYAYVIRRGDDPDFIVLDITVADAPVEIATLNVSDNPRNIFVNGDYVYIAGTGAELLIYNISTPSSPILTGSFNASGGRDGLGIYVVGTTAYLSRDGGSNDELVVIDVSNPASTSLLGSINLSADANEVYVLGNYAYIASDNNSQELQVVDVSNSAALSIVGNLDLAGSDNCDTVTGFGTVVILGCATGGLYVVDVSIPAVPAILGSISSFGDDIRDVALGNSNNYVFVGGDANVNEFAVYDISTLSAPTLLGSLSVNGDINGVAYYPAGDRVYGVGDDNTNELRVFAPQ